MNTLLAVALPPMLLVPVMGLLSAVESSGRLGRELRRKALHVAVGLIALALPSILTEAWMVLTATAAVLGWMLGIRLLPALRARFGACLHDAGRVSHGEIYYVIAIGGLLLIAETPLLYAIPLLILTLADAAAAIVGTAFPVGRLRGAAAGKTLSGCVTFFVVAYLLTAIPLLAFTSLGPLAASAVAALIATATSVTEAVSARGTDNITVPVAAYAGLLPFGAVSQHDAVDLMAAGRDLVSLIMGV